LLICLAVSAAVSLGRKSSQGLAREMTEHDMACVRINFSFAAKELYVLSMGRPRWSRGLEGSSSDERIIRRGGSEVSVG
jgi:hypothetical protein